MFKTYTDSIEEFVNEFLSPVKFSFEQFDLTQEIPIYEDLGELSSEDLSAYMSVLRGFSTYLMKQYMLAFTSKTFFENALENAESAAVMQFSLENPKATATAIKNCAVNSPEFLATKNQLSGAKIQLEGIEQYRQSIENLISTASRELSKRIGLNGKHRDENY